jgi:hypothetical protein
MVVRGLLETLTNRDSSRFDWWKNFESRFKGKNHFWRKIPQNLKGRPIQSYGGKNMQILN